MGQRLEIDYAERGNQIYLLIVCALTGFMQAHKTSNKSTSEALTCLRVWAVNWGLPYSIKSDYGPAFRQTWDEESKNMGDT